MKLNQFKIALLCCGVGFITFSCEKEDAIAKLAPQETLKAQSSSNLTVGKGQFELTTNPLADAGSNCAYDTYSKELFASIRNNAVAPSTCGPTDFNAAIRPYVLEFGDLEWEWYDLLTQINQLYTYTDNTKQYFGADGRLTNYATKEKRTLEKFWNMPNEVTLTGQHTKTLQNRDAIAAVYINFAGLTPAQAYDNADYLIANVINSSKAFKTTPLLSFDGFATTLPPSYPVKGDLIVIGDGIVQVLADAGIDEQIAFSGVLAHEWGHQVQFNNYQKWYGPRLNTAERTRTTELEADFFSSYYLTHKRGATYNWKRAAQFFNLFYNIGDCSFTSSGHHGTPNQRLAASRLGWIIAEVTFPKGHILNADELHNLYMAGYNSIITNTVESTEAYASLKSAHLKNIYTSVLKYENELKGIANGKIDSKQAENLD